MKYCMVAITLFCSASGSRSLEAGDDYAITDGFIEELFRQLKVLPVSAEKCQCQEGYDLRDGSCVRSVEFDPEEVCRSGKMVDGLCVTPAPQILQCPDEHITVCRSKDRAESPCCAKGETAEKEARCREGTETQDDHCTRILTHERVHECPPGYALSGSACVKQERGEASPTCVPPDVLSPEGDSCLTTMHQGFEYICPEEYECVARPLKKKKYSPLCSACAKTEETQPKCCCPEGEEELDGFCYEAGTYELCQSRKGLPRKQAPPKKKGGSAAEPYDYVPEVNCKPSGRVPCTCDHPFTLHCNDKSCSCVKRDIIPVVPVCRGQTDEDGNCIAQVQKRVLYQCADGFTCDIVNKKGRCNCVRVTSVEPTTRCAAGEEHEDKCIEVIREPKTVDCPLGYSETCCDNKCSCTKTTLAVREVRCAEGAVSIQGVCAYVSKPSPGCDGGMLRGEKCIQDFLAPPLCG